MDEEKLILLVSGYKELYDLSDKNYANQDRKNNCWKEISEYMKQPVSECKERWSRIRDNFRKALKFRKTKSGDAATKVKPYKYEIELSFLKPFLSDRCQKSNLDSSAPSSPQFQEEDSTDPNEESDNFVESQPPTPVSANSSESTPSASSSKGKRRIQPQTAPQKSVANVLEKYLECQSTGNAAHTGGNGLRQFFMAMADTVQLFPPRLQIEVKSKIFNIIHEAEVKCLQEKENVQVQNIPPRFQTENNYLANYLQGPQTHHMQPSTYVSHFPNISTSNFQGTNYDVNN